MTDAELKRRIKANQNLAVPLYLCASYAYYELDEPFLSDIAWEWMTKVLQDNWERIAHRHKHLITLDMLAAGTFLLGEGGKYPSIVIGATGSILRGSGGKRKRKT